MRRRTVSLFQCFIVSIVLIISSVVSAETKVDPFLQIMASQPTQALKAMKSFGLKSTTDGIIETDVLVKASTPENVQLVIDLIHGLNGKTQTIAGDIISAVIPLYAVSELEASEYVSYIEASKPVSKKMIHARITTGVEAVQNGTSPYVTTAYTGTGAIVGLVDSGIDCENADFKDASGNSRILYYWDQNTSGSGVPEISGSEGTEYSGTQMNDGTCASSQDSEGHGTHVAGIAAGNNTYYKGVAPTANIIMVKYKPLFPDSSSTAFSNTIVNGVSYIFKKANALRKPVVANLSLGTSLGPHDGTSLLEQALDNLLYNSSGLTNEKIGRAIVNAGGNERFSIYDPRILSNFDTTGNYTVSKLGGIHAGINVSSGSPKAYRFLTIDSTDTVYVDIWLAASSTCTVNLAARDRTATVTNYFSSSLSPVSAGSSLLNKVASDSLISASINFSDSVNSQNGKQHAVVSVGSVSGGNLKKYYFDLVFSGNCTTGDAWLYPDNNSSVDFTNDNIATSFGYSLAAGDSNYTMTIPSTAKKVISVASYLDRQYWVDVNGTSHDQTSTSGSDHTTYYTWGTSAALKYSTFSSAGPMVDQPSNVSKPELSAPGEPILSTLASNLTASSGFLGQYTAGKHVKQDGTSESAPHVAGTVALMFSRNGCLTPSSIKTYLTSQADGADGMDPEVGSVPNTDYGWGRLNAGKTMGQVTADATCQPTNSADATSGCSTDTDCPAGQVCSSGTCVSSSNTNCSLSKYTKINLTTILLAMFSIVGLIIGLYGIKIKKAL